MILSLEASEEEVVDRTFVATSKMIHIVYAVYV